MESDGSECGWLLGQSLDQDLRRRVCGRELVRILALIGSLRAASFSKKIAEAAAELAPEGTTVEIVDGRDLPLYDQDLDGDEKPESVVRLHEQVNGADALLFISPEFNYGIPGTLKNVTVLVSVATIDSSSAPHGRSRPPSR